MKRILLLFILSACAVVQSWAQSAPNSNTVIAKAPKQAPHKVINPYGLTSDDIKELVRARQEALKANPDLNKDVMELTQKMRDFQHKLDQAILQDSPDLAPVVSRIENGPGQRPPMPPLPSSSGQSPGASSAPTSH